MGELNLVAALEYNGAGGTGDLPANALPTGLIGLRAASLRGIVERSGDFLEELLKHL